MKQYALLAAAALCGLVSVLGARPATAVDFPFGEPYRLPGIREDAGDYIRGPYPVGGRVLVTSGRRIWSTDGTAEGTFELDGPPSDGFLSGWGVVLEGKRYPGLSNPPRYLWPTASDAGRPQLWRTDGTQEGTRLLRDDLAVSYWFSPSYASWDPSRALFFFAAAEHPTGGGSSLDGDFEPWVSDGTPAGTRLLKDLVPDSPSYPQEFHLLGQDVVFEAREPGDHEFAIWRSDGTEEGTTVVVQPESSELLYLLDPVGDTLYFRSQASPADQGSSLWASDGTAGGRRELHRFDDLDSLFLVQDLGDGRSLWVVWTHDETESLWVTDGTADGTVELLPLAPYSLFSSSFVSYHGTLYFTADDGSTGLEIWRTDGTPAGTRVALETCPGTCSELGSMSYDARSDLLLVHAVVSGHGWEWRTWDGKADHLELVADLCPGPCSLDSRGWVDVGGFAVFFRRVTPEEPYRLWATDYTAEGTRQIGDLSLVEGLFPGFLLNGRAIFEASRVAGGSGLWAIPVEPFEPPPPFGDWRSSPAVPGFSFKVRISGGAGAIQGTEEPSCIPETLCMSGAVPGRSEVFLRVVGPKPNGRLWPTLVKFSTSEVEVWVRQDGTGLVRYYDLAGARPGVDELPGLFDREGFAPASVVTTGLTADEPTVLATGEAPPPPSGPVFTSPSFPGFRFRVRISAGGEAQDVHQEAACIGETLCFSGAVPGRSELFVRIVGPKPNGKLWPTIVKFTTSTLEVWIEQVSTGETQYYRIEGAAPGKDDLTGLFDRNGFTP